MSPRVLTLIACSSGNTSDVANILHITDKTFLYQGYSQGLCIYSVRYNVLNK